PVLGLDAKDLVLRHARHPTGPVTGSTGEERDGAPGSVRGAPASLVPPPGRGGSTQLPPSSGLPSAGPMRRCWSEPTALQVLAGGHPLDRAPAGRFGVVCPLDERADVDDPLALLAGDLGPVV